MHLDRFRPRRFLPDDIDLNDPIALAPIFQRLEDTLAAADSPAALVEWLEDHDEVDAALRETAARAYIALTCQTDDPDRERIYLHIIEHVEPWLKPRQFALQQALAAHPHFAALPAHYDVFRRTVANRVRLYREENVPRETEEARLSQQYAKLCGAQTVEFEGAERTMPETDAILQDPDRARRQAAFEAVAARRLADREAMEDIFDRMLTLRGEMAHAAGFADYRDYAFAFHQRFDYTPEDCLRFHDAIEAHVVPLRRRLREERRRQLGVETLRPWDIDADPENRAPLRPFADADELVRRSRQLFAGFDDRMRADFDTMERGGLLDLASRKGKAPGGYQQTLAEARVPFIFMNAAGTQNDVRTLIHEAGHAFHALAAREQTPAVYRDAPIEFCEVASMGMEMLAAPRLGGFYPDAPELAARAWGEQLTGVVDLLAWVAVVDAFQHWLYTHPGHSRAERAAHWTELVERFGGGEDWSGHEEVRRYFWQRQLHFFQVPFYYVEYGIAQLGALQLWQRAQRDPAGAVEGYYDGLRLGGSRPLPDLFAAAGLKFDFSADALQPLMAAVDEELDGLLSFI